MSDLWEEWLGEPEDEFYPGSKQKKRDRLEVKPSASEWDKDPKHYSIGGVDYEFFFIGSLAIALNRRPVTLRKWEADGILPQAKYVVPSDAKQGKRRLYSRAQVEGMIKIAAEEGVLDNLQAAITKTRFTERVKELFRET